MQTGAIEFVSTSFCTSQNVEPLLADGAAHEPRQQYRRHVAPCSPSTQSRPGAQSSPFLQLAPSPPASAAAEKQSGIVPFCRRHPWLLLTEPLVSAPASSAFVAH